MPRAPHSRHRLRLGMALATVAALAATPAHAQGRWGGGRGNDWGNDWGPWGSPGAYGDAPRDDSSEGRVTVERFPAPDSAPLLGHGGITLAPPQPEDHPADGPPPGPPPGATPVPPGLESPPGSGPGIAPAPGYVSPREQAIYEAAVIDALVKAGYNTALPGNAATGTPTPASPQVVQLRITHHLLVPAERRRSPVSGEMAVGASNRGSMLGFGLNIDLSKPRPALISTTLTLRIRDAASGKPLWEGRASIATAEGSSRWPDQAIATRLATALFAGFPTANSAPTRR